MNLKDHKPVDLSRVKNARNRIYRVGVELEGGWDVLPKGTNKLEHDGSVRFGSIRVPFIGELPSPPTDPEEIETWLKKHYPNHVNETCGLHVHLSFKSPLSYQRLMDPRYPATILKGVSDWAHKVKLPLEHSLWPRLRGESIYCQHQFHADEQVMAIDKDHAQNRRGHRYTVINYCWGRTTTLECRLLPGMPTVDLAISAVKEVMDITNKYLVATAKRESKLMGEVLSNRRAVREVRNVRI